MTSRPEQERRSAARQRVNDDLAAEDARRYRNRLPGGDGDQLPNKNGPSTGASEIVEDLPNRTR
jgi:hypothetical protein